MWFDLFRIFPAWVHFSDQCSNCYYLIKFAVFALMSMWEGRPRRRKIFTRCSCSYCSLPALWECCPTCYCCLSLFSSILGLPLYSYKVSQQILISCRVLVWWINQLARLLFRQISFKFGMVYGWEDVNKCCCQACISSLRIILLWNWTEGFIRSLCLSFCLEFLWIIIVIILYKFTVLIFHYLQRLASIALVSRSPQFRLSFWAILNSQSGSASFSRFPEKYLK